MDNNEKLIDFCGNPKNNENVEKFKKLLTKDINLEFESKCTNKYDYHGPEGETALLRAIRANNINLIKILIENNVDVNHVRPTDKLSPLMLSAFNGQLSDKNFFGETNIRHNPNTDKIMQLLIKAGADIDYCAEGIGDVLIYWKGETKDSISFKYILENKKHFDALAYDQSNYFTSLLIKWIELEDYKLLHKKGTDIHCLNKYNHNPFFNAAAVNRLDIVMYLLENKADLTVVCTRKKQNIIEYLTSENNHEILNLISKYPFYKSLTESLVNIPRANKIKKI